MRTANSIWENEMPWNSFSELTKCSERQVLAGEMNLNLFNLLHSGQWISPGAKMGTWKCLRVQGFMIDPESIGVLKEIKLGCHDGNLGELFLFA